MLSFLLLTLLAKTCVAYDFPYEDPYYATMTVGILKADHLDKSLKYRDINLPATQPKEDIPYFPPSRQKITLRHWDPGQEGPLLVMVAGLGGNSSSSYLNFLGSKFVKKGFHVLALPSPFHWTFPLAAGRKGPPGASREDAMDLYETIQRGIHRLKKNGHTFRNIGLLGVSMGGLEAAFLSDLDSREKKIQWKKVLLINPPVDPIWGGKLLDTLVKKGHEISHENKSKLKEKVLLFGSKALMMRDIKSPDYFLSVEKELETSLVERQFLIGSSMREFLGALIFVSQQIKDRGILQNPVATNDPKARLEESGKLSFLDYLEKILFPALAETQSLPMEGLLAQSGLYALETHLRDNHSLFLMHNADDFIVNQEQLSFLKTTMKERMFLFPKGGHVGNIWFPENLEKIFTVFQDL